MPKYTGPQREKIREIVFESCVLAYRTSEIVRILAENGYKLGQRQVEIYVADAMVEIRAAGRIDREKMRGESVARLTRLYRSAIGKTEKDKRLALAVQRELDVIGGLVVQQNLNPAAKSFEDWLRQESATGDGDGGRPAGAGDPGPAAPRVPDSLDDEDIKEDDLHDPLGGEPFIPGPDAGAEGSPAGDAGGDGGGG